MKKIIILMLILLLTSLNVFASKREAVKLLKVYDGDTILVKARFFKQYTVRLVGIDCYETTPVNRAYKQAYENNISIDEVMRRGEKEKLFLIDYLKENSHKQLYLKKCGKDVYKRMLGIVYLGEVNINEYMYQSGNAMKFDF